jgi:universal stress protein A
MRGTRNAIAEVMSSVVNRRYRIVVALDLSEYAEIVLEHAIDVAARHATPDLHFVTVVADERADLVETKNQLAEQVLEALGELRGPDWHARLHVRVGKPDEEIVALAGEIDADLITIGRFGVSAPRRKLGSIAHRVLEQAPCPVLAINLLDRPLETHACDECVRVRAESDGERWFCAEHSAPDRPTLATVVLPALWTGGTLMW